MLQKTWQWILGMLYVIAVAVIWIAASFVVQSVVDSGVSPFLVTYICNTLFLVYLPIVEAGRILQPLFARLWQKHYADPSMPVGTVEGAESETDNLLGDGIVKQQDVETRAKDEDAEKSGSADNMVCMAEHADAGYEKLTVTEEASQPYASPRLWTRKETACASLFICPFWFLAQFTFNLSLKYTTVTSNTILSSTSSLFTFLMSLKFLQEKFTWVKLWSVLLCMAGTIVVSLSDSEAGSSTATNPAWGDLLCLISAVFYAVYTTLIWKKLPDETSGEEKASTALFFGFLGLFNGLVLFPVALLLHFTGVEPFHRLTLRQFGLIVGKGLLDNVLSDYLWAKAVLLTSTTAATAGLTIQVPIAAVVDSVRGIKLSMWEYVGGVAVLVGFFGINETATGCFTSDENNSTVEDPTASMQAIDSS